MDTDRLNAPLQLALDMTDLGRAEAVVRRLDGAVARLEVGTPLLLSAGSSAIESMRAAAPRAALIADTKICDAGGRIAWTAFDAGADIVTVVAAAIDDPTWDGVVAAAAGGGRGILIDAIGWSPDAAVLRAWCARAIAADVRAEVCVHRPKNDPGPFPELIADVRLDGLDVAYSVAGKMTADAVPAAMAAGFSTVIVGGAVADADDPRIEWDRFLRAAGA